LVGWYSIVHIKFWGEKNKTLYPPFFG
jgi:hypothetical protein